MEGSPLLLYQLFYNLVNNSLKFTKEGTVPVIAIRSKPAPPSVQTDNGERYAVIQVADNGIGFTRDQASTIFDTFTRLHSKDAYEGTGLGLSLCKKIAGRHGGAITAEGKTGEGATFTVLLPLTQS